MYDFYLSETESKRYLKGEHTMNIRHIFEHDERIENIFDLPCMERQKSFYGKAKVIETNYGRYLLSYDTVVCGLMYGGLFIKYWNDWSATTAKHINSFCKYTRIGNGFNKKEWLNLPEKMDSAKG